MSKPILATSQYCGPCTLLKEAIQKLDIEIKIHDMLEENAWFIANQIKSVPTLIHENNKITGADDILNYLQLLENTQTDK